MAEQIRYISISSVVLESVVLNKSFNKICAPLCNYLSSSKRETRLNTDLNPSLSHISHFEKVKIGYMSYCVMWLFCVFLEVKMDFLPLSPQTTQVSYSKRHDCKLS